MGGITGFVNDSIPYSAELKNGIKAFLAFIGLIFLDLAIWIITNPLWENTSASKILNIFFSAPLFFSLLAIIIVGIWLGYYSTRYFESSNFKVIGYVAFTLAILLIPAFLVGVILSKMKGLIQLIKKIKIEYN